MGPENVAKAVALNEDGRSIRYISNVLGVARNTVNYAIRRYNETGEYGRRQGSGRPRCTNERDDRYAVSTVLRNRHLPATIVAHRLAEVRNVIVSARTIRRRFHEVGLVSRRPATGPALEPRHRVARLQFARQHINWTRADWESVLFTDESRFALRSSDGRDHVWRRCGERYAPCTMSPRISFNGGSIIVWAGISVAARTELVFIENGTMNGDRYIEECIIPHVIPYAQFIGNAFQLMHDNARANTARIVSDVLNEVEINVMDWPARSPDLNPIENVWDILQKRVSRRVDVPETVHELRVHLQEEWYSIPQADIARLIGSVEGRLQEVIQAGGGNTRF